MSRSVQNCGLIGHKTGDKSRCGKEKVGSREQSSVIGERSGRGDRPNRGQGKVIDLGSKSKCLSPEKARDQTLEIREKIAEEGDIEENHLLILKEIEGLQEKSPLIQIIEMNQQVGERIIKMIEEERKDQEEKGTEESKHFQERKCHHW